MPEGAGEEGRGGGQEGEGRLSCQQDASIMPDDACSWRECDGGVRLNCQDALTLDSA